MNTATHRSNIEDFHPFYWLPAPKSTIQNFRIEKIADILCTFKSGPKYRTDFISYRSRVYLYSDSSSLKSEYFGTKTETIETEQNSFELTSEWISDDDINDSMIENDTTFSMSPINEYKINLRIKKVVKVLPKMFDPSES